MGDACGALMSSASTLDVGDRLRLAIVRGAIGASDHCNGGSGGKRLAKWAW